MPLCLSILARLMAYQDRQLNRSAATLHPLSTRRRRRTILQWGQRGDGELEGGEQLCHQMGR